jgi:hypothetical protein
MDVWLQESAPRLVGFLSFILISNQQTVRYMTNCYIVAAKRQLVFLAAERDFAGCSLPAFKLGDL